MRTFSIALAVLAGSAGLALAQPTPPEPEGGGSGAPTEPPPPPPHPTPPPPPPAPPMHAGDDDPRPQQLSFGIGAGYTFSLATSLQTPNTVSVRVRLPHGLAFEPILRISNASHTTTPAPPAMEVTDQTTELGAIVNVLIPIWHRGRADFDLVGSLAFDTDKVTNDTSNPDLNNKTTTTFAIGYGLEVGFWISRHWLVTMTATNPIVTLSQSTTNTTPLPSPPGVTVTTKDSSTTVGLIHDPTVAFVIHLFI